MSVHTHAYAYNGTKTKSNKRKRNTRWERWIVEFAHDTCISMEPRGSFIVCFCVCIQGTDFNANIGSAYLQSQPLAVAARSVSAGSCGLHGGKVPICRGGCLVAVHQQDVSSGKGDLCLRVSHAVVQGLEAHLARGRGRGPPLHRGGRHGGLGVHGLRHGSGDDRRELLGLLLLGLRSVRGMILQLQEPAWGLVAATGLGIIHLGEAGGPRAPLGCAS